MIWAFCIVIGLVSGFMAGLLGIGGGIVLVPALVYGLPQMGVTGAEVPRVAIATSLAVIVPTAISSARAHAVRKGINWQALYGLAPGVVAGSLVGAGILSLISSRTVVVIFVVFAFFSAWRMADLKAKTAQETTLAPLPGFSILALKGAGIGVMSALVGVGGGILAVPIMSAYVPLRTAIGTAAALGLPISLAAATTYLFPASPVGCASCVGYIFPPVVMAAGAATVFSAPLGAKAAHTLPVVALRRVFAVVLVSVAVDLTYKSFIQSGLAAELYRAIAGS